MLGTPNMGSPCADTVNEAFEETDNNEMHAMRELKPIIVRAFNTRVNDRKGVRFSVLIGIIPAPFTCLAKNVFGDGVVPIESAKYNLTDYEYAPREHTALTGREDFESFVMPRIAVGPKKARAEKTVAALEKTSDEALAFSAANERETPADRYGFNRYFQTASFKRRNDGQISADETKRENITAKKKIVLAAKQTQEIEIPAGDSGESGVLIVAGSDVVATLTDASGAILGKSEGGLEAMRNFFRMIRTNQKSSGALRLKLENLAPEEAIAYVVAFDAGGAADASSFTVEAGKPSAAGIVPLQAKWIESGAPVLQARVTGKIIGQEKEITFFDDGKHSDGAANDGIYGAAVEKLPKGEYFVEATAEADNVVKLAVARVSLGAPAPTRQTPRKGK